MKLFKKQNRNTYGFHFNWAAIFDMHTIHHGGNFSAGPAGFGPIGFHR